MSSIWERSEFLDLPLLHVCTFLSTDEILSLHKLSKMYYEVVNPAHFLYEYLRLRTKKRTNVLSKEEVLKVIKLIDHKGRFNFRQMDIAWIDNDNYWRARKDEKDSYFDEIAELVNVCWLSVNLKLTNAPRGVYAVRWRVKKSNSAHFTVSFNSSVTSEKVTSPVPDLKLSKSQTDFNTNWTTLRLGRVEVREEGQNLETSFSNLNGNWKSGVFVDYAELMWLGDCDEEINEEEEGENEDAEIGGERNEEEDSEDYGYDEYNSEDDDGRGGAGEYESD